MLLKFNVYKVWPIAFPEILVITSFGIYLNDFGVRSDHLMLYTFFIFTIMRKNVLRSKFSEKASIYKIVLLWLAILFVALLSTYANPNKINKLFFATTDNLLTPIIVIIIMRGYLFKSKIDAIDILIRVSRLLSIALSINTLIIFHHLITGNAPFTKYFLSAGTLDVETSVWLSSLRMGRYLGVFATPFEAGIVYSLGLLCWIYLATKKIKNSKIEYIKLLLVLLGGIFTVSKAFIILGVCIAVIYWVVVIKYSIIKMVNIKILLVLAVGLLMLTMLSEYWGGYKYFVRLFNTNSNKSAIELYSGGRYGTDNSKVISRYIEVIDNSPIIGFGLSKKSVLDNGYLEILWVSGFTGLVLFILIACHGNVILPVDLIPSPSGYTSV